MISRGKLLIPVQTYNVMEVADRMGISRLTYRNDLGMPDGEL